MADSIWTPENPGYRFDLEDRSVAGPVSQIPKAFATFSRPREIDPRKWHRIENQGPMGSCFPPGTKVTMADGRLLPIEDVRFGDYVLSHKGRIQPVTDTMNRLYSGEMVRLFVKGWGKIAATADHQFFAMRDGKEQWVAAGDLTKDDFVLVSSGVPSAESETVEIDRYLTGHVSVDDGQVRRGIAGSGFIPNELPLDDLTCWVLGNYCAEGSGAFNGAGEPSRSVWTTHQDETEAHEKISAFAGRLGLSASIVQRDGTKAVNVRIDNSALSEFLMQACGRFCNRKRVPVFIMRGGESQKLAFLRGYFYGDGSDAKMRSGRLSSAGNLVSCNQVHVATASRTLAQQVATLCVSLGMKPGRSFTRRRDHQRFHSYQTYLYSRDACRLMMVDYRSRSGRSLHIAEHGQWRPVREIQRYEVAELPVYDFTVGEDHSFVAQGVAVHNCQGHSLSSCLEHQWWVATGGEIKQFSRIFAYLGTQKIDGLLGGDRGSTISGGVRLAREFGLPLESDVPYPQPIAYPNRNRINSILSAANYAKAEPFKVRTVVRITSYEQWMQWVGGGGSINLGISWPITLDRNGICRSFPGGGRGGHAIAGLGYDANGLPWIANSHGERYGEAGWFRATPDAINQMLRHRYTSAWGISDMAQPTPRRVDFRQTKVMV